MPLCGANQHRTKIRIAPAGRGGILAASLLAFGAMGCGDGDADEPVAASDETQGASVEAPATGDDDPAGTADGTDDVPSADDVPADDEDPVVAPTDDGVPGADATGDGPSDEAEAPPESPPAAAEAPPVRAPRRRARSDRYHPTNPDNPPNEPLYGLPD
ncbi:MAG: hypothetical protein R3B82_03565 [Sandaracinaceae bacterium]